jgi:hypothetical protein
MHWPNLRFGYRLAAVMVANSSTLPLISGSANRSNHVVQLQSPSPS